jgi:pimeloyl-ACP methyl ester carboxylesterase/glycosidase
MRAIHLSREARHRHGLEETTDARGAFGVRDVAAARQAARQINLDRAAGNAPGPPTVTGGELIAIGVLHEVFHRLVERYDEAIAPGVVTSAIDAAAEAAGRARVERTIRGLARDFGREPDPTAGTTTPAGGRRARRSDPAALPPARAEPLPPGHDPVPPDDAAEIQREALVEGLLLAIVNEDPAAERLRDLFDDRALRREGAYPRVLEAIEDRLVAAWQSPDGDGEPTAARPAARTALLDRPLPELLRAPSQASPTSLAGQLRWIRDHWGELVTDVEGLEDRLLLAADLVAEEERALHQRFGAGGPGPAAAPDFGGLEAEQERFSTDTDWMPRVVLMAKSTYVWLDQLSRRYGLDIRTLDAIPDEELDRMAAWGVTGLWLIGLWQRSEASARIKHLRGNPDAVASAYSLDDYRIADDLGGEGACVALRERAAARGIRLASDMVPNHMGIDSRWVIEHPERFLSVAESPYPAYAFSGPDLSLDPGVEIVLDDHYWDDSDAAVVFRRRDTRTGATRFVYHGNDGTSFPWNDTAQLDYLQAEVREAVIRTILDVARRFPIIRFDAAMVLARKHVRRLWWPEPGSGGGIPSRAEHALSRAAFEKAMPNEFWREVVDRVAAEVPGTLLLAEAFWLMEGYFVRTLGMHRVYNSAFMHMLRDEDNAGYRKVIRETLEFDPAILGRYVNFMTNPDEETAIEQFGTGDKYFGVATLLATLPGLPMVGHGQVEGFTEKYGMEYRRARLDEVPNEGFMAHFEAQIAPLFRERGRFAGSSDFRLYDLIGGGGVIEDVFAYSNGRGGERSIVAYQNSFGTADGRIRESVAFAVKDPDGAKTLRREVLADALGLDGPDDGWLRFHDRRSGLEGVASVGEIRREGFPIHLDAYGRLLLDDLREVASTDKAPWAALARELGGRWVPSLDAELERLVKDRGRAAAGVRAADPGRALATAKPRLERRVKLEDGRTLAVAEWGDPDGTPVILLHGRPGSRLFTPDPATTEALGVRLLTFDRPGYGESDAVPGRTIADGADDVAAVAAQLGLERITVAGWSSGGPFALAAAARYPALVSAVAVIAGDGPPDGLPREELASSPEGLAIVEAARRGDPAARERTLARLAWYADDPTGFLDRQATDDAASPSADPDALLRRRPEVLEALRMLFAEGARGGAAGFADDWLGWVRPWGVDLAAITAPVDLWWGDADKLSPRPHLDALVRAMPRATVHVVPGAGHLIALTSWREILEGLLRPAPPAR